MEEIANKLETLAKINGIDLNDIIYSINKADAIAAIAEEYGSKALKMSAKELINAIDLIEKGVSWGLGDVWWDVMRTAASNIPTPGDDDTDMEMEEVRVNGVKCLFTDQGRQSKLTANAEYPYIFDIRHGDSGEPCTIEQTVTVNYFGSILSPVDFLEGGKEYCEINTCAACNCGQPDFIYL